LNGTIIGGIFENITTSFSGEFYNNIPQDFTNFHTKIPEAATRFIISPGIKFTNVILREGEVTSSEKEIRGETCEPSFPGKQNLDFSKLPNPSSSFKTDGDGCQLVIGNSGLSFLIMIIGVISLLLFTRKRNYTKQ